MTCSCCGKEEIQVDTLYVVIKTNLETRKCAIPLSDSPTFKAKGIDGVNSEIKMYLHNYYTYKTEQEVQTQEWMYFYLEKKDKTYFTAYGTTRNREGLDIWVPLNDPRSISNFLELKEEIRKGENDLTACQKFLSCLPKYSVPLYPVTPTIPDPPAPPPPPPVKKESLLDKFRKIWKSPVEDVKIDI